MLFTLSDQHWLEPVPLDGVAHVGALARLDEERWMLAGRLTHNAGFAAVFNPLRGELQYLPTPKTRAFVAGAANPDRGVGLVVGGHGVALRLGAAGSDAVLLPGEPDLTAGAVDVLDRHWVASVGALWTRDPRQEAQFRPAWRDPGWLTPFISLMADAGMVVAMTADGGIVEGRM